MIHWLVAGVGDIATKRVIPAILAEPRSRLAAVVTSQPAKAAAYGVRGYGSLEEGLTDPSVNALYVATPVALHRGSVLAALAAGKHVLCEKPVAMNYSEASEMAAAAAASPLVCAVVRLMMDHSNNNPHLNSSLSAPPGTAPAGFAATTLLLFNVNRCCSAFTVARASFVRVASRQLKRLVEFWANLLS